MFPQEEIFLAWRRLRQTSLCTDSPRELRPCWFALSALCSQDDANKLLKRREVSTRVLHFEWKKNNPTVGNWSRCRCVFIYIRQHLFQFLSAKDGGFLFSSLASRWAWFLGIICGSYRPKPAAAVTAENFPQWADLLLKVQRESEPNYMYILLTKQSENLQKCRLKYGLI